MARDIQPHELRREFDKAVKIALAQTAGKLGAEFTKQISGLTKPFVRMVKRSQLLETLSI